jgi:hypothetical protein
MSETTSYPYETRLNIHCQQGEVIGDASALRLVLRDAVTMIAAGLALLLPCVAALGKLVQSQLCGVTATDPATIAAAAMVLAAGALAAAFMLA